MTPLALILSLSGLATADPCGMVPPIGTGAVPLQRDGIQRTYVMHSRGFETMVPVSYTHLTLPTICSV